MQPPPAPKGSSDGASVGEPKRVQLSLRVGKETLKMMSLTELEALETAIANQFLAAERKRKEQTQQAKELEEKFKKEVKEMEAERYVALETMERWPGRQGGSATEIVNEEEATNRASVEIAMEIVASPAIGATSGDPS